MKKLILGILFFICCISTSILSWNNFANAQVVTKLVGNIPIKIFTKSVPTSDGGILIFSSSTMMKSTIDVTYYSPTLEYNGAPVAFGYGSVLADLKTRTPTEWAETFGGLEYGRSPDGHPIRRQEFILPEYLKTLIRNRNYVLITVRITGNKKDQVYELTPETMSEMEQIFDYSKKKK